MDNSGRGLLRVPGFGGIPIHYVLPGEKRVAHGVDDWEQVPIITARELAIVAVMNTLTDKPEWQVKIFDDQIVNEWRKEAFATTPLMSEKAWTWCVAELGDKNIYFEQNQYLRVWTQAPVSASPTHSFQSPLSQSSNQESRPCSSKWPKTCNLNLMRRCWILFIRHFSHWFMGEAWYWEMGAKST